MSPSIRNRSGLTLLLSTLIAALFVTPALAFSGNDLDVGRVLSTAAAKPAPYFGAELALATTRVHKPDGRIRLGTHGYPGKATSYRATFVGNNVYNTTGAGQKATVENFNELDGAYHTFDISIQNDGNRADRFKVRATGTATTGWTVTYSHGTTNITSSVVAGTYQTASLEPGATYLIRAKITVKSGANVTRLVTIRSVADATKVDAVRFAYKQTACGC